MNEIKQGNRINPKDMTEEQNNILESVFDYKDKAEISEEDYKFLLESFPTPKHLAVLRKVLGILTKEELGLLYPVPETNLQAEVTDAEYKFNHQLQVKTDESIRQSLANLYLTIKFKLTNKQRKIFEKHNKERAKEEVRQEEIQEEQDANMRGVGKLI